MASGNSSDLVEVHHGGDYCSEFEYDSEAEKQRNKRKDLAVKHKEKSHKVAPRSECEAEYSKDEGRRQRFHILSMDAYSRHKKFINDYMIYYGGKWSEFKQNKSVGKTDLDVIRENHRFLWTEEDNPDDSWEKRMSKKYYDKLFKEYCISDLSRYKENKVAMRWRIEKEVVEGK
ncbi:protein FRA10AC1, partial [Lingula anatina]|uniref:Protein FRA10AC1 n=1 Tax=Lingula anatina TaxID=7574 RepID=A0A1S3H2A6_LINAN